MGSTVKSRNVRLAVTLVLAVAGWTAVQELGLSQVPHPLRGEMRAAELRTERAFALVDSAKRANGRGFPADSRLPWPGLLGEDYTPLTTTLGSREAKEVSTNPAWASVFIRLLYGAGVDKGDTVGVLISASFPALAVAALAALHEMGATPQLVSSLGASSFGANVRGGTWLDWERWLRESGVLSVRSAMVTAGGENDAAIGLPPEGSAWLDEAAMRNGVRVERHESFEDAVSARMSLLMRSHPKAIINIGGGQASVGACRHSASLPVGLWRSPPGCRCPDRGVLARCYERGVPVIHLLRIRELAAKYGLDSDPGALYSDVSGITTITRVSRSWIIAALSVIIGLVAVSGKRSF
jgi:poly-gamma-glutamate system protein